MREDALAGCSHVAHVGYHKTASTWLQLSVFPHLARYCFADARLRQLGLDLATADDGVFDADRTREALSAVATGSGQRLLLSNEGLSGSLWEGGAQGLRSAERLADVLPGARILVLVRRQDEMLRSIHAQYVNEGGTLGLGDFIAARSVEGSRFELGHLEYDRLAARYVALFGRAHVRVMPYERLRADPAAFLSELCDFLGTSLTREVSRARRNRSLSPLSLRLLRIWNRLFRASAFNPRPLVAALPGGRRVRTLAQRRIDPALRHFWRSRGRRRDDSMLADLASRFAESNRRLQSLCAHPLAAWGYPLAASTPVLRAHAWAGAERY
jgi:hypothetical protein